MKMIDFDFANLYNILKFNEIVMNKHFLCNESIMVIPDICMMK